MSAIYDHFYALHKDKQERIKSAGYRVFGRYGYKKTSVEEIAKQAEISKSMIFHYFGSKLGFFELLMHESVAFIKRYMNDMPSEFETSDYIEQYRVATKRKLQAFRAGPEIFEFHTRLFLDSDEVSIRDEIKAEYRALLKAREQMLEAMQMSDNTKRFRKDMDPGRIKELITWTIEGYSQKLIVEISQEVPEKALQRDYWSEFDEVLDDLKKVYYE